MCSGIAFHFSYCLYYSHMKIRYSLPIHSLGTQWVYPEPSFHVLKTVLNRALTRCLFSCLALVFRSGLISYDLRDV